MSLRQTLLILFLEHIYVVLTKPHPLLFCSLGKRPQLFINASFTNIICDFAVTRDFSLLNLRLIIHHCNFPDFPRQILLPL